MEKYVVQKKIIETSLSEIFLAKCNKKLIVIKQVSKKDKYDIESSFLKIIDHPNIVKLHLCEYPFIITDYCGKWNLDEYKNFNEENSQKFILQILEALKYLHNLRIIHGDIKPGNIIIDSNEKATLIDFNLSVFEQMNAKPRGTSTFCDPLMIKENRMTYYSDIWSLGATFLHSFGQDPLQCYKFKDNKELFQKMRENPQLPKINTSSKKINHILSLLLELNPKHRKSADFLCSKTKKII